MGLIALSRKCYPYPDLTSRSEMQIKNSKVYCSKQRYSNKVPNFKYKQFALFSFNLIVSRWYLKERFSSKKRPKYFVLLSIFIFCPLFLKLIFLIFLGFFYLNRTNSVLSTFSNICYLLATQQYFWDQNRFAWTENIVSSAMWWKSENPTSLLRSLIYIRKRSGPRTEPYRTPYSIERMSELILLTETNCFQFSR